MIKTILFLLSLIAMTFIQSNAQTRGKTASTDICIYGATSAGVMAAYAAAKQGKKVLLIEPTNHTGGLSAGGLGYTDIGNKYAISGLALDFYRKLGKHYGKFEQWVFEPHVAGNLFKQYLKSAAIAPHFGYRLTEVEKKNNSITAVSFVAPDGSNFMVMAKIYIDCSYEGDLMAKAGVSYTVGREDNKQYDETYNGVQLLDKHQFVDGVDPYVIKGKPQSGLLWGISAENLSPNGTGDKKVQAYNFRLCLTDSTENQVAITRPDNYDSTKYELLLRVMEVEPNRPYDKIMNPNMMAHRKTDINNNGPFSTDMIGMNYDYPEATYERRAAIQKDHEDYIKGFLYFIGHDKRVPAHLQQEMLRWGYPKDEYITNGHWSPQMYVREARRMVGAYVMTQANCQGKVTVEDAIGMAAYTMDSHNCQRIVVEKNGMKMVKNEGDVQIGGFPPYPIAYRSLIPKKKECSNLIVPVCLSATHIAYGSIRMEPVFMVLAQSSANAAIIAIDEKKAVQDIDVKKIQQMNRNNPFADGSTADILIDNENRSQLEVKGNWTLNKDPKNSYAVSSLITEGSFNASGSVKFIPEIPADKKYKLFTYLPKNERQSSKLYVDVFDGKGLYETVSNLKDFTVEGQTSGEWLYIGEYNFKKGKTGYINVKAKGDGVIIADAVILVAADK
jgi:hypothetical protein